MLRPPLEMVAARFGVPVLHDSPALAAWLGVTSGHLDWFADRFSFERRVDSERLRHYRRSWIRKANRSGHPDFRAHLLGRIAWVAAANPARAEKLHLAFDAVPWTSA